MLATIILANLAAVFAFLFGATYDWSSIVPRSKRLNKFASFAMVMTLVFVTISVVRSTAA
jgi:hypothetical protein